MIDHTTVSAIAGIVIIAGMMVIYWHCVRAIARSCSPEFVATVAVVGVIGNAIREIMQ